MTTAVAVRLEDVDDVSAYVGAVVARKFPDAGPQEREELHAEGMAIIYYLHSQWSGGGTFSGYAGKWLPLQLIGVRERSRLAPVPVEAVPEPRPAGEGRRRVEAGHVSLPADTFDVEHAFLDVDCLQRRVYWLQREAYEQRHAASLAYSLAERDARIAGMVVSGHDQAAIASTVGIGERQVRRIVTDLAGVVPTTGVPAIVPSAIPCSARTVEDSTTISVAPDRFAGSHMRR